MNEIQKTFSRNGLGWSAANDCRCVAQLGSVLVIPQLSPWELWEQNGKALLSTFVIPLLSQLQRDHVGKLDSDQITAIGYSDGAKGALLAGIHHPDVFTAVVAASPEHGPRSNVMPD